MKGIGLLMLALIAGLMLVAASPDLSDLTASAGMLVFFALMFGAVISIVGDGLITWK